MIDWLSIACDFDLAPLFGVKYHLKLRKITQLNGIKKYIIETRDEILSKENGFIYNEGFFASDDYITDTRFDTKEEAIEVLQKLKHLL